MLLLTLLLFTATPAEAFRCGNRIVTEGDLVDPILNICGEPTAARAWIEVQVRPLLYDQRAHRNYGYYSVGPGVPVEVLVEEWVYNLGARRFTRVLRFENGYLVKIRTEKYGYPDP